MAWGARIAQEGSHPTREACRTLLPGPWGGSPASAGVGENAVKALPPPRLRGDDSMPPEALDAPTLAAHSGSRALGVRPPPRSCCQPSQLPTYT